MTTESEAGEKSAISELREWFYAVPVEASTDDWVIALIATLSDEIQCAFPQSEWVARADSVRNVLLGDLMASMQFKTAN